MSNISILVSDFYEVVKRVDLFPPRRSEKLEADLFMSRSG